MDNDKTPPEERQTVHLSEEGSLSLPIFYLKDHEAYSTLLDRWRALMK